MDPTPSWAIELLGPGGIVREVREPQIAMAQLVERCLRDRLNALIEAGTGTGKSLAYLVPALAAGKPVIVSTHTKALQAQLYTKEVPFLLAAFRERGIAPFRAALLKGAQNYACNRKVAEASQGVLFEEFARVPVSALRWAASTPSGDLDEAPADLDEAAQRAIAVDPDDCDGKSCPYWQECFSRRAKERAQGADLVIVNHALFARMISMGVVLELDTFAAAYVDEAHQFEDAARDAFAGRVSPTMIRQLETLVERYIAPSELRASTSDHEREERDHWLAALRDFKEAMYRLMLPWMDPSDQRKDVLISLEYVRENARAAAAALQVIADWVFGRVDLEALTKNERRAVRKVEALADFFNVLEGGDVITVARRDVRDGEKYARVTLESFPLNVGPRLARSLYPKLPVVFTSATLAVGPSFEQAIKALGVAPDVPCMVAASPFDYGRNALLYVPRGIPNPDQPGRLDAVCRHIQQLLEVSGGGAFVLFPSRATMRAAFDRCRRLPFPMRIQDDTPKAALVEWFQRTQGSVLFATASFWEGVSIEGHALRLVILEKVPFPPPDDPIHEAREAILKARKLNAFRLLSVPEAIIKLKQGFGRLIRTQTDRGVVAILDSRIHAQDYGRRIIAALPRVGVYDQLNEGVFRALFASPDEGGQADEATAQLEAAAAKAQREYLAAMWQPGDGSPPPPPPPPRTARPTLPPPPPPRRASWNDVDPRIGF